MSDSVTYQPLTPAQRFWCESAALGVLLAPLVGARVAIGPGHPGVIFIALVLISALLMWAGNRWDARRGGERLSPEESERRRAIETLAEPSWLTALSHGLRWSALSLIFSLMASNEVLDWRGAAILARIWLIILPLPLLCGFLSARFERGQARRELARATDTGV